MPNLDRPLNLRSAITAFASFVMLAGAAFGQTEPGEPVPPMTRRTNRKRRNPSINSSRICSIERLM